VDVVVLIVAGAAVALMVLWPTRAAARRLVLRWLGTGEPTAAQLDLARRDLWRRRAPLMVVAAVVFGTLASLGVLTNLWALVGALLLSLGLVPYRAAVILTGWLPDGSGPIGAMGGDGPPVPRWLELLANLSPMLGLVLSLTGLVLWRWIAAPPRPAPALV